jgi:hypothetical protein
MWSTLSNVVRYCRSFTHSSRQYQMAICCLSAMNVSLLRNIHSTWVQHRMSSVCNLVSWHPPLLTVPQLAFDHVAYICTQRGCTANSLLNSKVSIDEQK